jgi:hypothetical protein
MPIELFSRSLVISVFQVIIHNNSLAFSLTILRLVPSFYPFNMLYFMISNHNRFLKAGQNGATRQSLLDRQTQIINSIMSDARYPMYRDHRVQYIQHEMREMVDPLMNRLADRQSANHDLGVIAEHAWDLSARLLTSRLTFEFRFPEVASRFSASSMVPVFPDLDPAELQTQHWRVAMVVTPVITARNDTSSNISVHGVTISDVICMQ